MSNCLRPPNILTYIMAFVLESSLRYFPCWNTIHTCKWFLNPTCSVDLLKTFEATVHVISHLRRAYITRCTIWQHSSESRYTLEAAEMHCRKRIISTLIAQNQPAKPCEGHLAKSGLMLDEKVFFMISNCIHFYQVLC